MMNLQKLFSYTGLLLSLLFLNWITAPGLHAQIKLDSNGDVGIGTSSLSSDTRLTVKYAGGGNPTVIDAIYTGSSNNTVIGVRGEAEVDPLTGYGGSFKGSFVGVEGNATYGGDGGNFAVKGQAGSADWFNYGIYGSAGSGSNAKAGYFSGDVEVTGNLTTGSDRRLKENVQSFSDQNTLDRLTNLSPKSFDYRQDSKYESFNFPSGKQYGLIAQEVETIFPELVDIAVHPVNESSATKEEAVMEYKTVNYSQLIPLLIQALKDQQRQIENLKQKIEN